MITTRYLLPGLAFVLAACLWVLISSFALIDPVFLPSPAKVAQSVMSLLSVSFFKEHLATTLFRVGVAYMISVGVALPLGIVCSGFPSLAQAIVPACGFTRYLPVAAFVPLCILWFGIGDSQKIAVIVIGVVFQLILLVAADTTAVPAELIETAKTLGLSRFEIIRRVVLPHSMPAIWDDLRISAGWAWSYVVLSELVAGNRGIGYFIVQSQRYLETGKVFAGILFIGLLGLLTDVAFRAAGKRLFRWV